MIRFANIEFIWMLGLVGLIIFLMFYARKKSKESLEQFADLTLVDKLLEDYNPKFKNTKHNLLVGSLVFLSIALIGPQVGKDLKKVERKGVDILIAMDVSASMNAPDVSPSRLQRAQHEVNNFIDRLKGDRVGLVAFAGVSYLHCPLTLDYSAARLFLDILDTGVIQTQGTDISGAIETALEAFKEDSEKNKVILVISDGEDHQGEIDQAVQKAKNQGVNIYSIGVGTKGGSPIPVKNEQGETVRYKKNKQGNIVTTKLKESTLQKIAQTANGKYARLSDQNNAFEEIYEEVLGLDQKEYDTYEYSDYKTRYQIFLGIGLAMLMTSLYIGTLNRQKG